MSSVLSSLSSHFDWEDALSPEALANETVRKFCDDHNFDTFFSLPEETQELVVLNRVDEHFRENILAACFALTPRKRARRARKCPPPSSLGNYSDSCEFRRCLFNHRPKHGLHVSLQVETFGQFQDKLKVEGIPEGKYMEAATKLMLASAEEHDEQTKVSNYIPILADVFADYETSRSMLWVSTGQSKSDISITNGKNILVNFEIKRELCATKTEPVLENLGYFIRFTKEGPYIPMFLVSIAGPYYLQVFGAAWNDDDICMDPLSDPLSLLYVPCDPSSSIVKLARVLEALSSLAKELTPTELQRGPYLSHTELEILGRYKPHTNVFKAKWGRWSAIVKFAQTYGLDVHQCLYQHGLAPEIFYFASLPGKWFVVVMKREGTSLPNSLSADIKQSLKNVLSVLQKNGYVHGDLRRPNILVVGTTVRVLDFDWAGKVEEARYPSDLNESCVQWHADVGKGQLIKPEHDNHLISLLLKELQ